MCGVVLSIIGGCTFIYKNANDVDGVYDFDARGTDKVVLTINKSKYEICYKTCATGEFFLYADPGYDQGLFKSGAMLEFARAYGAAIDPDENGEMTVVRIPFERSIVGPMFGVYNAKESLERSGYRYFRKRIGYKEIVR